jgi:uncharacterized YigZ family protein
MTGDSMRSILATTTFETEVAKSKFIAVLTPVKTPDDIELQLHSIRTQYPGANHYCYAYRLGPGGEQQRYSDDGEPHKTAGLPMLDLLLRAEATNVLAIVVRYFGGTLLGTGGLVRSYQGTLKGALEQVVWTTETQIVHCEVTVQFTDIYGLEGLLRAKVEHLEVDYQDVIIFRFDLLAPELQAFQEAVAKETHYKSYFVVAGIFTEYR